MNKNHHFDRQPVRSRTTGQFEPAAQLPKASEMHSAYLAPRRTRIIPSRVLNSPVRHEAAQVAETIAQLLKGKV